MSAKTKKIIALFAAETSFNLTPHGENWPAVRPNPGEAIRAYQILMLRSQHESRRPFVPFSALNDRLCQHKPSSNNK